MKFDTLIGAEGRSSPAVIYIVFFEEKDGSSRRPLGVYATTVSHFEYRERKATGTSVRRFPLALAMSANERIELMNHLKLAMRITEITGDRENENYAHHMGIAW